MLTNERHEMILNLLAEKQTVNINELIELTAASESTIRRDLNELETLNKLERIHGGATVNGRISQEPSILDKSTKNLQEKIGLAKYAASFVQEGDCIFLDAGTTTVQMIPYLQNKQVIVVTNGLTHVDSLIEHGITAYLVGGYVKSKTRALVGPQTIQSLHDYRFDKCFLGVNGFHLEYGYTTPDPEEAAVKRLASSLARTTYVVADHSKYNKVSFSSITALEDAVLIVNDFQQEAIESLKKKTTVEVVAR
ncbi:DeoR/GlpR family DNA-binding transcription regulator [Sporosarcina sp. JAI121]|uniref:DeoR/GlpR family DNA-binding transcription regulator n=1 Tax=Sporosarcina sp. JAI121 TaxID=2723064 RepID=UPI0015CDFCED|nr:DeoR/GlpR family DNA-binding transcription regulator [Sporosarcina sp. JAI121]NYF25354.1 DeoR family fructose operon transcriptional repressor [Sporosarcina sp. JAI121]